MISCNRISCRSFPFYLISTLLIHIHLSLSWGNTYLSDAEMLQLGYSTSGAQNVGALYSVYKAPYHSCEQIYKRATVVYIGGVTCLTAAHCMRDESSCFGYFDPGEYFKISDKVSFEINGIHTYFDVKHCKIHPDYDGTQLHDIAILCLDRIVDGLDGLEPDYSLGTRNLEWNRNCQDVLTYIGYGQGGNDSDYCISVDDKRRACQSRLLKVQGPIIMSQPYHACLDITSATMWTLYPRKAFAYESIARPAMSGGATLLNDAFVGLNVGESYTFLPWCTGVLFNSYYYVNTCINFFMIGNLPWLRCIYPAVGAVSGSVALGPHEQWIKDWKSTYDSCVADYV